MRCEHNVSKDGPIKKLKILKDHKNIGLRMSENVIWEKQKAN